MRGGRGSIDRSLLLRSGPRTACPPARSTLIGRRVPRSSRRWRKIRHWPQRGMVAGAVHVVRMRSARRYDSKAPAGRHLRRWCKGLTHNQRSLRRRRYHMRFRWSEDTPRERRHCYWRSSTPGDQNGAQRPPVRKIERRLLMNNASCLMILGIQCALLSPRAMTSAVAARSDPDTIVESRYVAACSSSRRGVSPIVRLRAIHVGVLAVLDMHWYSWRGTI
ncbi:uncharacterized protein C8Q71DRAFT_731377 [Rhodofomes roseus]|uniref:Uncharacterized protein n=1 Tax=Rhodofomes roseus TaxID=34475 RepID=A0ABQ8KYJ5_9APHY|nr:uncharacterized protein C8Q71DRAFT_731377 [Rhodofomes roseus]KAH9844123.1 hypothetical protein C8Q71DRAFT_731377 [Rhodofomes roseus]